MKPCEANPQLCTPRCWEDADRLAEGEAVPGGHGACSACHHAQVWHKPKTSTHPCERCGCRRYSPALQRSA